ncbi:MAG TPA: Rieske 2Fe-2S domain-containing protein [Chloroflexota bacterium]|nr:Rieske 2Fe-2S domain-containing protein [Chloroflexota bacterium]
MADKEDSPSTTVWVNVLSASDLPVGVARKVTVGQTSLVVGRVEDLIFAILDLCPHLELPFSAFGPLDVQRERLVCPWHFWEFDVRTGRCEYAALYRDDEMFFFQIEGKDRPIGDTAGGLRRFPARFDGDTIQVQLPLELCPSQE